MTKAANRTVCNTIAISGRGPTTASEPIEVRIPNADTAQRRHQRDVVLSAAAMSGPIMPRLFTATSATNATRNIGSSGTLWVFAFCERRVTKPIVTTAGNKHDTRSNLTIVDVRINHHGQSA